ncbi:hypothetical protein SODG_001875 [Sodalis praecaptivus]
MTLGAGSWLISMVATVILLRAASGVSGAAIGTLPYQVNRHFSAGLAR